jgi:hypothetical protein
MPTFLSLRDALVVAAIVGWIALPVAAALDARRRCHSRAAAWGTLAVGLLLPYVGLLLYVAARPRETIDERRHRRALERYLTGAAAEAANPIEPGEIASTTATPALVEQVAV